MHFSSKDSGFFSKKSENKRVKSASESWERLNELTNKILCANSDSEQWKSIWKNEELTSKTIKA